MGLAGVHPRTGGDRLGRTRIARLLGALARLRRARQPPSAPAVAAGLRLSTLATTIERWWNTNSAAPTLRAGLSRRREGELLAAWHGTEADAEALERYDRERSFKVPPPTAPPVNPAGQRNAERPRPEAGPFPMCLSLRR
nr:hypothetical protein GCM10025732_19420 [Glycomyces mayteni]